MREGAEEGGRGRWTSEDETMDRKNWAGAGLHPPPPFFPTPFQTSKIFFSPAGKKKGLLRHTFVLLTNGVQVSLIHKLWSQ